MAKTYSAIQTITAAGGESSVTFTNIPQNYTDLKVVFSSRVSGTGDRSMSVTFSGSSTGYSYRAIYATGSGVSPTTATGQSNLWIGYSNNASDTSSTFSNCDFYVYNYTSTSNAKAVLGTAAWETNATANIDLATVGLWSIGTQVGVTIITFTPASGTLIAGSTFTLYGIGSGAKASGGTVSSDGKYIYHTFLSTGAFVPTEQIKNAEVLAVAGGGATGVRFSGGGGAGGVVYLPGNTFAAGTVYVCTVGAGGASPANNGVNSQVAALTAAVGGGFGGSTNYNSGLSGNGGSGGGAMGYSTNSPGTAISGQGNIGGSGASAVRNGGGGGGAGGVGESANNNHGGNGGVGTSVYSAWGAATGTGQLVGSTFYYAGGGGGGTNLGNGGSDGTFDYHGLGGYGGGGNGGAGNNGGASENLQTETSGTANTGGGGGGNEQAGSAGNGGSGLIIIRYPVIQ